MAKETENKKISTRDIIERMASDIEAEEAESQASVTVPQKDKSLMEEIAKLSEEEKQKLKTMLGISDGATKSEEEEDSGEEEEKEEEEEE